MLSCSSCYEEPSRIPTDFVSEEFDRGNTPEGLSIKDWLQQQEIPSKIPKKDDRVVSYLIIVVMIGAILLVSAFGYSILDNYRSDIKQDIQALEDELAVTLNNIDSSNLDLTNLESDLAMYQGYLQENNTELHNLTSGNEFQLHNPTYNEAVEFLDNDTSKDAFSVLENAKKQGIRCAILEVTMTRGLVIVGGTSTYYVEYWMGFDTIDEGIVYFETITNYRAFPENGNYYDECVEEYGSGWSDFDRFIIKEILEFW
jgi:hypothetical protein